MEIFGSSTPIIDAHVHVWFENQDYANIAQDNGAAFSIEGLKKECQENNVTHVCGIYNKFDDDTPVGVEAIKRYKQVMPGMIGIAVINPNKVSKKHIKATEDAIVQGVVKGIKIYQGYYPLACSDRRWWPFYELAAKHDIPVHVHAGDVIGEGALLRYARPLFVDEIAVRFPETKFIITQLANPWFVDAAEVAYKNDNVYLETAGLFSGLGFSKLYNERLQFVIDFIDDPKKMLFGSDWPTVRLKQYIEFIKKVFPKEMHRRLFYENAKRLYKL